MGMARRNRVSVGKPEHMKEDVGDAPAGSRARELHNLALGIERIGLISLRFPALVTIVVAALCIAAAFGVSRIKVDDSLSQLFRSNSPEFKQYEEVSRRFPSSEFDVLVVIEGKTLLERSSLEKLRDVVTDLQLIDGTRGIISLFSAREPPQNGQLPAALFPENLPRGAEFDALIKRVKANEIIRGKLLSEDGELALIVLSLKPEVVESKGLSDVVGEIRKTVADDIAGSELKGQLSGVPVMQLEIRNAVERDRLVYNAIGFAAGCLIAILFFRRVSFMIIAAAPPLIGILLSLGVLGWLDFRLNIFLNVMTPLIMVMGFSDSMQLTFAARARLLGSGDDKYAAMRRAILVVGPACVLTHATAGLSFVALLFSDSDLIRTFGMAGVVSTIIAFISVLTLVALLGVLLLPKGRSFAEKVGASDFGVNALVSTCGWIAGRIVSRPYVFSLLSALLVGSLALVYANLEPRYRLADQVPDREQAVQASGRLDAKLTGANPIDVLVTFPKGASLYAPETLATIADVHAIVEKQAGVGNVLSLETLRRWLAEKAGVSDVAVLKEYVDMLPEYLKRRFISHEQDAVLVTGRIPDVDASQLLPVVEKLDKALDSVRMRRPGYTMAVTGLAAIAARNSANMIGKLNRGLTVEMIFVAAFIGLAFRSLYVMLWSILPGIFPIVLSGTVLWALGEGLQFASIVALTVAFGLGLSATIHYLNRLRLEARPDEDPALGVKRATMLVGPALILTSVVLACGLAVTIFSDLPSLRLFGWLSAFAMIAALIGDLLILPATVMFVRRIARALRGRPAAPNPAE
jgi:predicted RND superfamily exporter protein